MGQMSKAIQLLMTIGISAGAVALVGGCSTATPATQANATGIRSDVTDVQPIAPAVQVAYQPPVYDTTTNIPTAQQPVMTDRPAVAKVVDRAPVVNRTPVLSTTPSIKGIGEKKHTVRHGETLFSIARSIYGDGKAWKKIVSANPGLTPAKLRVGQVLAMPS